MAKVNRMTLHNEVKDFALQIVLPTLKFLWAKLYIYRFICELKDAKWESSSQERYRQSSVTNKSELVLARDGVQRTIIRLASCISI